MIFEHKKGVVSDFGGIPEKIGKTIRCFCERFLPFILIVFSQINHSMSLMRIFGQYS